MGNDRIIGFEQTSSAGWTTAVLWGWTGEDGFVGTTDAKDVTVKVLARGCSKRIERLGRLEPAGSHQGLLTKLLPATHHIAAEWVFHFVQVVSIFS